MKVVYPTFESAVFGLVVIEKNKLAQTATAYPVVIKFDDFKPMLCRNGSIAYAAEITTGSDVICLHASDVRKHGIRFGIWNSLHGGPKPSNMQEFMRFIQSPKSFLEPDLLDMCGRNETYLNIIGGQYSTFYIVLQDPPCPNFQIITLRLLVEQKLRRELAAYGGNDSISCIESCKHIQHFQHELNTHYATIIQRTYRKCISDPKYIMCIKRRRSIYTI